MLHRSWKLCSFSADFCFLRSALIQILLTFEVDETRHGAPFIPGAFRQLITVSSTWHNFLDYLIVSPICCNTWEVLLENRLLWLFLVAATPLWTNRIRWLSFLSLQVEDEVLQHDAHTFLSWMMGHFYLFLDRNPTAHEADMNILWPGSLHIKFFKTFVEKITQIIWFSLHLHKASY